MKKFIFIILFIFILISCSRLPELQKETTQKEITTEEEAKETTTKITQGAQDLTKSLDELNEILES